MRLRNPFSNIEKALDLPVGRFNTAKTQIEDFLRANDDKEFIEEVQLRAVLTIPVPDRVWNEILKALNL